MAWSDVAAGIILYNSSAGVTWGIVPGNSGNSGGHYTELFRRRQPPAEEATGPKRRELNSV